MNMMTFRRWCEAKGFVATPALLCWLLPSQALAQQDDTGAGSWLSRVVETDVPLSMKTLLGVLAGMGAAFGVYLLWYRFRLEGDIRQFRKPSQTKLAAWGLAVLAFAAFFGAIAQAGLLWVLLLIFLGAVLQAVASSWISAVLTLVVGLVLTAGRILNVY